VLGAVVSPKPGVIPVEQCLRTSGGAVSIALPFPTASLLAAAPLAASVASSPGITPMVAHVGSQR
jgi:hypothetical protein